MFELGGGFFRETFFVAEYVTHQTGNFAQGSSDQDPNSIFLKLWKHLSLKYFKKQFSVSSLKHFVKNS